MCTTPGCDSNWGRKLFWNECPECMFELGQTAHGDAFDRLKPQLQSRWHVMKVDPATQLQDVQAKLLTAEAKLLSAEAKLEAAYAFWASWRPP